MYDDLEAHSLDPMFDRIIVEPDDVPEATQSGLIIPGPARAKPDTGTVIACGPGRIDNFGMVHAVPVAPGERILFSQHAGTELSVDDGKYLILSAGDVLAVIRTPEERERRRQQAEEAQRLADEAQQRQD